MINNISYYVEIKQVVIKTQLKNMSNLVSEINKIKIRTDGNGILYFMEYEPYWIKHYGVKEKILNLRTQILKFQT